MFFVILIIFFIKFLVKFINFVVFVGGVFKEVVVLVRKEFCLCVIFNLLRIYWLIFGKLVKMFVTIFWDLF